MEDSTGSKVFTSPKGWEPRSVCLRWLITVFIHSCHCYASIFITVLSRSKHDIRQSFASRKWEQWITLNIVADCMGSFRHYFKRNVHHSCIYAATLFQCQIYIPSLISGANSKKYKADTVEPSFLLRTLGGSIESVFIYLARQAQKGRGRGRNGKGKGGTPRQNALRMSTKFNIRSTFYFRSRI